MRCIYLIYVMLAAGAMLASLPGCPRSPNALFHQAQVQQTTQQFDQALATYDKVLAKDPQSLMALFGKARCTYELGRYDEALALYEDFLTRSEEQKAIYRDERYDAEFYRDKCKQQLGQAVEQDPTKIPPPPMGE